MAFARGRVDFIPPAQANQTTSSNILEVVEVDGEEDQGENEDKDTAEKVSSIAGMVCTRQTDKFLMKRTPKRYMSRLPVGRACVSPDAVRSAGPVQYLSGNLGSRVM